MEITINASEPPDVQWTLEYWYRILDNTSREGMQKLYEGACWALEMSENQAWSPYIEAARWKLDSFRIKIQLPETSPSKASNDLHPRGAH